MDADETAAVARLLEWLMDLSGAGAARVYADEKANEDSAVQAAMLLADRAGLPELSGRTVGKHWQTLISHRADSPDPEDCGACMRLRDTCPFHRGVDRGVAYSADWMKHRIQGHDQSINPENVTDLALEMIATA